MSVVLVRHTRPAVAEGVCYGITDLDLAPTFDEEAAAVVAALPFAERLVSSPLRRCRLLAERIGAARGIAPAFDDRLREFDFGAWEGVRWDAIPKAELDAWAADFFHARPHGGESVARLSERVRSAIADYRQSGLTHLVVTHAGVIKAALARSGHADGWQADIEFGSQVHLTHD